MAAPHDPFHLGSPAPVCGWGWLGWLLALVFGVAVGWADKVPGSLRPEYSIRVFDPKDGLSEFALASVACTPDGALWFSTFHSVVRFDGKRFERLSLPDVGSNTLARTRTVFVDRQGRLWVGAQGQILRRDAAGWRSFGAAEGVTPTLIHEFAETPTGELWAASMREVLRLRGERFEEVSPKAGLGEERTCLAVEADGTVWCAGEQFLGRWTGTGWETVLSVADLAPNRIRGLRGARAGGLWVACERDVRRRVGGAWVQRLARPAGHIGDAVRMVEDSRGNLWLGGWRSGLLMFGADGQVREALAKEGLANPSVADLTLDTEENVWLASNGGGLVRLRRQTLEGYGREVGLAQIVNSVSEERPGRMLVGTHGDGLAVLEGGRCEWPGLWPETNFIAGVWVHGVLRDRAGELWAATYSPGLLWQHDGAWQRIPTEDTGARIINSLFEDRAGRLWAGTAAGLAVREVGGFRPILPAEGLPSLSVRGLAEDDAGRLWVCGPELGLFRRTAGGFARVTVPGVAASAGFVALLGGQEGTIWAGLVEGGLVRIEAGGQRSFCYTAAQGLPEGSILSLVEDAAGDLWCGATAGVLRISRRSLQLVAVGAKRRLECQVFDKEDGLPGAPRGGFQPAAWRAGDGRLWFATLRGVAVADPTRLPLSLPPPQVEIHAVRLDGQAVLHRFVPPERLSFVTGSQQLEIHFSAIRLGTPDRLRFRWRLAPEAAWEEADRSQVTRLLALRPGSYRYEVQAADVDGVWGPSAVLEYRVRPRFWQTGWFVTLAIAGAGSVGWLAYRRRLQVLSELHQAQRTLAQRLLDREELWRRKTAVDLHDGLGQLLQVIRNRAIMAIAAGLPAAGKEHVAAISEAAESAVDEARSLVRDLRPHYLEQLGLTRSLHYLVTQVAQAGTIQWERSIDPIEGLLPPEQHIHLFRIVQECLTNVIRHSGATAAGLVVTRSDAAVTVEVWDNGRGMPSAGGAEHPAAPAGLGLRSLKERVHFLGGDFRLLPAAQGGVRVSVRLPLSPPPS